MHFNTYDVFYSQNSRQNVSAHIPTIFKVMLLLQEHKVTKVANSGTVIPQYLKL
jgi:hypothetical protein